jgi:hypothetical protein
MTAVAQIEDSIRTLPPESFLELLGWMSERHLEVLREQNDGHESPELEAELLKALDSPRYPLDEAFLDSIRKSWPSNQRAAVETPACPA